MPITMIVSLQNSITVNLSLLHAQTFKQDIAKCSISPNTTTIACSENKAI